MHVTRHAHPVRVTEGMWHVVCIIMAEPLWIKKAISVMYYLSLSLVVDCAVVYMLDPVVS